MALHRFFATCAVPEQGVLPLSPRDVHHARTVARIMPGEKIVLAFGGRAWRVRVTAVGEQLAGVRLEEVPPRALPRVTLAQALPKGAKLDAIVRQATELGVARIVPFSAERSVVRLEGAKAEARAERWRRIAEEAAKQSQRASVPEVLAPVTVAELAVLLRRSATVVCWEEALGGPGIGEALEMLGARTEALARDVAVVVGPEGGLAAHEVETLSDAGAAVATLGETVLRVDTASVAACALVLYELGALGARS